MFFNVIFFIAASLILNYVFCNRFKFATVTSGEFRDVFISYFKSSEDGWINTLRASYPQPATAAPAAKGKKGKKGSKADVPTVVKDIALEEQAALLSVIAQVDWDTLFFSVGMPSHPAPDFSNPLATNVESLAQQIILFAGSREKVLPASIASVDISVGVNGVNICCDEGMKHQLRFCLVVLGMVFKTEDTFVGFIANFH